MFRPSVRHLLGPCRLVLDLLCPLLTSACASQHLSMSVAQARMQISLGITHPPSRLCLSDLRRCVPYKFWALAILAASPHNVASYPLPVRQASALPSASSRFPVTQNTLAVQLTLPLVGRVEDFHLQVSAPCRAHKERPARFIPPRGPIAGATSIRVGEHQRGLHYTTSMAFCKFAVLPSSPQGGCGFARHGTYRRVTPAGTLIPRWYCPQGHCTFSLLPDHLAARRPRLFQRGYPYKLSYSP